MSLIKSRFAPSPTGNLHIGGVRTALFAWLAAKVSQGKFIVRIEDTDSERSTKDSTQGILYSLAWLGIEGDEAITYQSKRFELYKQAVDFLLEKKLAYYCYATVAELDELRTNQRLKGVKPRYDGRYRDFNGVPPSSIVPAIRFKNPLAGNVIFEDVVRGTVTVDNSELDDLVIMRADGSPTYNFCAVVDDTAMGISHVVRGDDHINNTPRQINIGMALEGFYQYKQPVFAHLPMVLGEDGTRLSKRHGATSVLEYQRLGYLPDALLNYLARLGWGQGDQEIFTRDELCANFSLDRISSSPANFNSEKLLWVNQQHIMLASLSNLTTYLIPLLDYSIADYSAVYIEKVIDLCREKHKTLVGIAQAIKYFFVDIDDYDEKLALKHFNVKTKPILTQLKIDLEKLVDWQAENIKEAINNCAEKLAVGMGKVAMPLRLAITGGGQSPSIELVVELLGKKLVIERLEKSILTIG